MNVLAREGQREEVEIQGSSMMGPKVWTMMVGDGDSIPVLLRCEGNLLLDTYLDKRLIKPHTNLYGSAHACWKQYLEKMPNVHSSVIGYETPRSTARFMVENPRSCNYFYKHKPTPTVKVGERVVGGVWDAYYFARSRE